LVPNVKRSERRHGGDSKRDQRSEHQRDRDRILYSTALRRLAGITQVVGAAEGHVFHNRLTHTLEVAQLARRLSEVLQKSELSDTVGGVEPEVAEAAALAHDLGHPPFGHIAEEEIDAQITEQLRVDDGFEGNAQTFPVVTKLSVRYRDSAGQDLTAATLNAILKYPWMRGTSGYAMKKYGAYRTEEEDFSWARSVQLHTAGDEKSAEAEIMDWADDIAYAVHDVEDFFRAGFIPLDRILADPLPERSCPRKLVASWTEHSLGGMRTSGRRNHSDRQLREAFVRLLEYLREAHQITEPYDGSLTQRANLRGLTSTLITRYVGAISLRDPTPAKPRLVRIESVPEREITMLKQLTWFYVIQRPSLAAQQKGQRRVIRELFEILHDASAKNHDMLPPGAWEHYQREKADGLHSEEALRARLAGDVICSLSE
jgi:dGTPase